MATAPKTLDPPFFDPPIVDAASGQQQHSQAWTEYHQQAADQISAANAQIATLTTQLAGVGHGVTDGSDAAAGQVGEYLNGYVAGVSLTNGVTANVASLSLTAGDWDVSGNVVFSAGSGTHTFFGVGIGGLDTYSAATYSSAALNWGITTATSRYNVSAPTTVWVVANAQFTGTCTAAGRIRARRMR